MTFTKTRAVWVGKETPESFITNDGELVPIRYLKKKYHLKYECCSIKDVCNKLNIEIVKPNGLYNIPCISKNKVEILLDNVK
jgi:hypothetical protein